MFKKNDFKFNDTNNTNSTILYKYHYINYTLISVDISKVLLCAPFLICEESKTPLILISSHGKCADVVPGNSHSLINFGNSANLIYLIIFSLSASDLRGTIMFKLGSTVHYFVSFFIFYPK